MPRPIKILLILAVILVGGWFLASRYQPKYPVARTITDKRGRSLDVHILGRTHDGITIERISDQKRFHIPLINLSGDDQRFVSRLPYTPSSESNYVAIRRKEIAELKKKATLYERELNSRTLNRLLHAKRREDLAKVLNEIKSLEVAIENHKYLTKEK